MRSSRLALVLALTGLLTGVAPVGAWSPQSDSSASAGVDRAYALVQLRGAPLATSATTRPAKGKKVDFQNAAVKAYREQLRAVRAAYKAWLRANAPQARVTGEFDIALNAVGVRLNGHSLAQIRGPQVLSVQYERLYVPLGHDDPDLALIDAAQAWSRLAGNAGKGDGVKVAIVDSGVDASHPCFDDAAYAETNNPGAHEPFTNDKVIFAGVFNMKAKSRGYTAEAIDSHGTHVAGTVACNEHTPATVDGVDIPYDISGVAPRALLGNFNVFPKDVANAHSEDIVNALDEAYEQGFDVANMSLGGRSAGNNDLLAMAVDNLDRANMVIAVAAGNSGPGHYTVESPGKAARALTAGASTVGHYVGAPVTVGGSTYGAAAGEFETVEADLTAPLAVVTAPDPHPATGLAQACSALPAGSLTGKIALIGRGTCDFSTKIRFAELAGAIAVLVGNHSAGDPTAMALGASPDGVQPTVPAYMVSKTSAIELKAKNGQSTTIDSTLAYFNTNNDDILASFSSQGPTDVDFRVKPDVLAPGVNVLSSVPANACDDPPCFAFFQGTSMATPHLAGSAAVVIGQHRNWAAWQVRSAIVNTAERDVVTDFTTGTVAVTDVNVQGGGRENLDNAVQAVVALDPVSISFGAIPAGAGQSRALAVVLSNTTGSSRTYTLSIASTTGTGVSYTVSPASVTIAAGGSATVQVSMSAVKAASRGDHQAWLNISSGGSTVAHAAIYTLVK